MLLEKNTWHLGYLLREAEGGVLWKAGLPFLDCGTAFDFSAWGLCWLRCQHSVPLTAQASAPGSAVEVQRISTHINTSLCPAQACEGNILRHLNFCWPILLTSWSREPHRVRQKCQVRHCLRHFYSPHSLILSLKNIPKVSVDVHSVLLKGNHLSLGGEEVDIWFLVVSVGDTLLLSLQGIEWPPAPPSSRYSGISDHRKGVKSFVRSNPQRQGD